jgi:hypothetical protein
VVLHQEVTMTQDPAGLQGLSEAEVQALARFHLRIGRRPTLMTALAETARRLMWWLLADLVVVALAWAAGTRRMALLGLGVALVPFGMTAWGWRHLGRRQQLLWQYAVGDWNSVRRLAARLRTAGDVSDLLNFDLDVRLACIEARSGKVGEALLAVVPWKAKLAEQPGLYESRVSAVHLAAGDYEGFVRLMGQAAERSGGEPARVLDHALALARFGEVERAAKLLHSLDPSLLPPLASGFLHWARGMVQWRCGEAEGCPTLGLAVSEFLQRADQPAAWTALAFCATDHALALHQAGQTALAQQQVASVWPLLQAHATEQWLQELKAQGLQPSPSQDTKGPWTPSA